MTVHLCIEYPMEGTNMQLIEDGSVVLTDAERVVLAWHQDLVATEGLSHLDSSLRICEGLVDKGIIPSIIDEQFVEFLALGDFTPVTPVMAV